jgi:tRNA pseudouridine55 synthase
MRKTVTETPLVPDSFPRDGMVLIDKPAGMTSQQVVTRVKRTLCLSKAGHAGTLDPMATGLLVLGLGRATRLLGYLSDKDKQYTATIRLGQGMTTDDFEGDPMGQVADATSLTTAMIEKVMGTYCGDIDQVPSTVSAIKVDGRRAYALARAGEEVRLKARRVTVSEWTLLGRTDNPPWVDLDVRVDCSSGTYIRALARDLGRDLGVGAHLTALRRTRVGKLSLNDAVILDDVCSTRVIDMVSMAGYVAPIIDVDEALAHQIASGKTIDLDTPTDLVALTHGPTFVGLYRRDPDDSTKAKPVAVFLSSAKDLHHG